MYGTVLFVGSITNRCPGKESALPSSLFLGEEYLIQTALERAANIQPIVNEFISKAVPKSSLYPVPYEERIMKTESQSDLCKKPTHAS